MGEVEAKILLVYFYGLCPLLLQRVVFCYERSVDRPVLLVIVCCYFRLDKNSVRKMQEAQKL